METEVATSYNPVELPGEGGKHQPNHKNFHPKSVLPIRHTGTKDETEIEGGASHCLDQLEPQLRGKSQALTLLMISGYACSQEYSITVSREASFSSGN